MSTPNLAPNQTPVVNPNEPLGVNVATLRTEPVSVKEEPTIVIPAVQVQAAANLLRVMEGRLDTLELDLLADFNVSLEKAKKLIADDILELRHLLNMDGGV